MKLIPHRLAAPSWYKGIRSLVPTGSRVGPRSDSVALPPVPTTLTLTLKLFRRERAISTFDDTFNPPHRSSPSFSTLVSSVFQWVLPHLHPGHASVTWFRVYRPQLVARLRLAFPNGHCPPTACRHVVSGSVSSPFGVLPIVRSRYYSLSVAREYLALRDGPRGFGLTFTC